MGIYSAPLYTGHRQFGIFTSYAPLQKHLCLTALINYPFCNYCNEAIEGVSHFICYCNNQCAIPTIALWQWVYTPLILTVQQ